MSSAQFSKIIPSTLTRNIQLKDHTDAPKRFTANDLRIGVYVCHCGKNIGGAVRCQEVAEYARTLPGVVLAMDSLYTCSEPGQEQIKHDIKENQLNRVVVAACTPRLHEPTLSRVRGRRPESVFTRNGEHTRALFLGASSRQRRCHRKGQGPG